MANRLAHYTEVDVKRAVKGVLKAGAKPREVFCSAEGVRIIIEHSDDKTTADDWEDIRNDPS